MSSVPYILYIEDDDLEVMKFKMAMAKYGMEYPLEIAANGEEGLTFLKSKLHELPRLIILDLRMPRMNGFEFLEVIKNDVALKRIPIIVLTSSNDENDVTQSFDLQVAGYFVKPFDPEDYNKMILQIENYWTTSRISNS